VKKHRSTARFPVYLGKIPGASSYVRQILGKRVRNKKYVATSLADADMVRRAVKARWVNHAF